jgi:hypothetical protein
MITADQVRQAKQAAIAASNEYFQTKLGGRDQFACGFAWVEVYVERTNSKQAQELIKAGFKAHKTLTPKKLVRMQWPRCCRIWD